MREWGRTKEEKRTLPGSFIASVTRNRAMRHAFVAAKPICGLSLFMRNLTPLDRHGTSSLTNLPNNFNDLGGLNDQSDESGTRFFSHFKNQLII